MTEIKAGDMTNKGKVEKIVYLTFASQGCPIATCTDEPIPGGKGIICARIEGKDIPLGELTLITNNP